jgi:hypothetical protein
MYSLIFKKFNKKFKIKMNLNLSKITRLNPSNIKEFTINTNLRQTTMVFRFIEKCALSKYQIKKHINRLRKSLNFENKGRRLLKSAI